MKPRDEVIRITASMTVACAAGAAILGAVYVATDRYQRAAQLADERGAIVELLGLGPGAEVTEVRQSLDPGVAGQPATRAVIYEARPLGDHGAPRRFAFSLDGVPVPVAGAAGARAQRAPEPLGHLFVARQGGREAGFVVEGMAQGYKNPIRFLVALTPAFEIAGVRVVEHQEDPGLGAEVATRGFEDQFVGRTADDVARLDVTRDPMPEDWHAALLERERGRPIYAVTGATISSRALTGGVRATIDHFRRRWALIQPQLEGGS